MPPFPPTLMLLWFSLPPSPRTRLSTLLCHYSHEPRCDPALSKGQALFAQNTGLSVPLATILTCVPLRETPSFPPVWQSFSSIVPYMYSSERSPLLISIYRCVNRLVRAVPVPSSLSVVALVVDTPVPPHASVTLVLATPFTIQIHYAVTRLFPWSRRSSRKTQVFLSRWLLS